MRVGIGSDHGGWELKEYIKGVIAEMRGIDVEDVGTTSAESVDYPDFAWRVADGVADGTYDRGILVCGTGVGMAITANKVKGVRAAVVTDPVTARLSRAHNDTNVLALGGRIIGPEVAADIVRVWLTTEFERGGRHQRRVEKIMSRGG